MERILKVKINGKEATTGPLTLSSQDETNGMELTFDAIAKYKCGDIVQVWDKNELRFLGSIITLEHNLRPPHSYTCLDFSRNLNSETVIQFKKIRVDTAIKKVLGKYGISCSVCKIPTKVSKLYRSNLLDIVKDLLEEAEDDQDKRYFIEVNGSKVYVKQSRSIKIKPEFVIAADSGVSRSIEDRRNKVVAIPKTESAKILGTAKDSKSIKKYGLMQANYEVSDKMNKVKAKKKAESKLKRLDKTTNSTSRTLIVKSGAWDIRPHRKIYINDGMLKGWFYIQNVTLEVEDGIYKATVGLEWRTDS